MLNGVAVFFVLNESNLRSGESWCNFGTTLVQFGAKKADSVVKFQIFGFASGKRKSPDFSGLLNGGQRRDRTADTRIFSPSFLL